MARGCRPGPPRAPPRGPGAAGVRLPPRRRPLRRARARGPGSGVRGPGPGPGAGPGGSPPPAPWYVPAYGVRAGPQGLGGGVRVPRARPTDSARRARGRAAALALLTARLLAGRPSGPPGTARLLPGQAR
ncbi:PREDICTED: vasodilator-stimulated phosphoprotein-like [Capra hircus]|uniref:vasodilator-stimulated phosphoprotein-like n=1 Tax=Capra hircus TaxID=9925 RepID=UPI00084659CA|nr:PREDICTED: vasodilator-stimulated phosphoprotein-like [Capra hircus]